MIKTDSYNIIAMNLLHIDLSRNLTSIIIKHYVQAVGLIQLVPLRYFNGASGGAKFMYYYQFHMIASFLLDKRYHMVGKYLSL